MAEDNYEIVAKRFFEKMLGISLEKRKLVVGYDSNKKPQIHEFDLVAEDMSVIGEIKSGKPSYSNYTRALADCLFLERVEAEKKILVFINKEFYAFFKARAEGIISTEIDVMLMPSELVRV